MSESVQWVVFTIGGQRVALELAAVERVVRAVEITPLPKAPEIVQGVINVEGRIVPVFNLRRRFGMADRELGPDDQMIVARIPGRRAALVVDEAIGVAAYPAEAVTRAARILPGLEHLEGVVKCEDGLIFIHDLSRFLSVPEDCALGEAMRTEEGRQAADPGEKRDDR